MRVLILSLYYTLLPIFLLICLPAYLLKMYRRGGFGTGLLERFSLYRLPAAQEPKGGLYVHAVSVGEAFIALKFIKEWHKKHDEPVVLALSTATGHQVAREMRLPNLRVLYAPLDVPGLPRRALNRFAPRAVVLIEAELWPNFAEICHSRQIPLLMLNARLSPRSEGRYAKIRSITELLFSRLNAMGAQNERDVARFARIGIRPEIISVTGSIKFDVLGDQVPIKREDFASILQSLAQGKPVVLAASTHAGEELAIASSIRAAGAFPLIVPRHAERREEVLADLSNAGFSVALRSRGELAPCDCYVADTTGELRDWTQFAQVVVIGKSFLAQGGQNPVEAIAAGIPVIVGPNMSNFSDLLQLLRDVGGVAQVELPELSSTISKLLHDEELRKAQCDAALSTLTPHAGATTRSVELVEKYYC